MTAELKKINAERKIAVVLTDGASSITELKDEYNKAQKAGIQCLGITIGDHGGILDNVFGQKNNIVVDPNDHTAIGEAFIKILKDTIKESI